MKNDEKRAEVIGKAGRDDGKELRKRTGKGLDDGKQLRRMESERLGPSPPRADFEKTLGGCRRVPRIRAAAANDGDGGVQRREVCSVACCPPRNTFEAQRMVQPDRLVKSFFLGKGQARADERPRPLLLGEVMALKTKESVRSALFISHL